MCRLADSAAAALRAAAVPVLFGTDAGALPYGRVDLEARALARLGWRPEAVLRAATGDAARHLGLEREIVTIVGGFSTALALARASDLIASVPERHTGALRAGMHSFALPVPAPEIMVSLLWHPRLDADPAHRWLRGCVREVCAEQAGASAAGAGAAED